VTAVVRLQLNHVTSQTAHLGQHQPSPYRSPSATAPISKCSRGSQEESAQPCIPNHRQRCITLHCRVPLSCNAAPQAAESLTRGFQPASSHVHCPFTSMRITSSLHCTAVVSQTLPLCCTLQRRLRPGHWQRSTATAAAAASAAGSTRSCVCRTWAWRSRPS
jgi:hypothetical protein